VIDQKMVEGSQWRPMIGELNPPGAISTVDAPLLPPASGGSGVKPSTPGVPRPRTPGWPGSAHCSRETSPGCGSG
jgi:hypothetical protein